VDYFKKNGMLNPITSVNIALATDTTDISLIRSQCGELVYDNSWKMIFAANDEEFEKLWDNMCVQLEGFGWNELVKFDTEKNQVVIDTRKAE